MREEIKNYIETADEKVVKIVHAILEVDAEESIEEDLDWWASVPGDVKADLKESLKQGERGEGILHEVVMEELKKKYSRWFSR